MRCNGLPNACDPSDLRKYIHMWLEDFKNANKKEINWLLKVNEQSILTQNQNTVDLSRANLRKLQPDTGTYVATVKMKIALTFSLFAKVVCMQNEPMKSQGSQTKWMPSLEINILYRHRN